MRLDRALVARGLARSRTHAQALIEAGAVTLDGKTATKASLEISERQTVFVTDSGYVSRAAYKLIGALDACAALGLDVDGRTALDAGASTGGFTQVLLDRGATHVTAVDVGHGQLAATIAKDPRVTAIEGLNVRDLTAEHLPGPIDLVVADLSFISLTLVTEPLTRALASGDLVLMVKPQFEVGKSKLGAGGVVTNRDDRARAVAAVAQSLQRLGVVIHNIARSELPGLTGNVEFFVWGSLAWDSRHSDGHPRPALTDADLVAAIESATEGRL